MTSPPTSDVLRAEIAALKERIENCDVQYGHPDYSLREYADHMRMIALEAIALLRCGDRDATLEEAAKVCIDTAFATKYAHMKTAQMYAAAIRALKTSAAKVKP